MTDFELLKERIIDALERENHTHKSLRRTLSDEYGYGDDTVSRGISELNSEGVIAHEKGFFELTDDRT
ncbi:hypothetical protein [Natrinema soli]|uniref:Uncharacterized protein n=1 Tax=Natrinema soli TaxID=1930624 RepID=A0ABD5SX32_9EURY|nr:hypothetical protein [Natrinema soli]